MKHFTLSVFFAAAVCGFSIGTSQATLIDRGGGLIYDDVLDVTWLQDVGLAPSVSLTWNDANAWAAGLEYSDSVRGVVWDDWRLPKTIDNPISLLYDTDGTQSELSYMYYQNLGYAPLYDGTPSDPSPVSDAYNPFVNLDYRAYWSETPSSTRENRAWALHFHFGYLAVGNMGDGLRAWAVRDGDVAAPVSVPEPASLGLLAAGLAGLGFARRRRA